MAENANAVGLRIALPCVNTWSGSGELGQFLATLHPYWTDPRPVRLDFSRCGFLSAEGAAVLVIFKLRRDAGGWQTELDWDTVPSGLATQFGRWHVSPLFGRGNHPWADNAVPLLHQTKLDPRQLVGYICSHVQSGQNMPVMTDALVREVRRSFCELFQNVFVHSASPCGGIAVGQFYPKTKEVQLCVCDGGVGMARRILGAGLTFGAPGEALSWALQEGTTTRSDPTGPPGGLGLFLLREFVRTNGGSLRVVANDGYLCESAGTLTTQTLPVDFPGTLIQVRFLVRDDVVYTLAPA
ncbi:Uncharacterized protein OS=Singulisphaera acidiphila (strain ATCC BAA-1392 / DSM 18658 / VKM B-2454 / MOB10) GN=Sinac_4287 PE=4 SV=1 [Gemmataceae bacterium]|nr:Uncharacterized protein OS=Singulisphaera acidiphila (strain ATCC BAA-1392 / DSM 18658 / VKM B-2454 / MOB10) GN=Sinac_4287 PE=4 SV=1 [Gemmataceae bacterium]VTT97575.1 Uncharacterized protein OS=Singulisphaera acidiphila (strain ATCC BAA-1392 / DSM 18658 / VKM B-2454 / MOB10) GN=Sinac_4287 PE=4 SV=1 [Gemmataceae bacterium]